MTDLTIPDAYYADYALESLRHAADLAEAQRLVDSANWHDMREWGREVTLLRFDYQEEGIP